MKFATLLLVGTFFLAMACEEEENSIGFVTPSATASEGDSIQTITINLGKKVTSATTITYIVGGSAALDGDYKILSTPRFFSSSALTLTVEEGESTATLMFQLIDDTHVETRNESIYFKITNVSDSKLNASLQQVEYILQIEDNDLPPDNGLQADLSWSVGEGVSINEANFDLYLARQLVLNADGEITSLELVDQLASTNKSGFESFTITTDIADESYYIIIRFMEGTSDANVFLQFSQGDESGFASGAVTTDYVGKDLYYGPISKSGNNFTFR